MRAQKIRTKNVNETLVIEKPVQSQRHGCSKIYLTDFVYGIEDGDDVELDASFWTLGYETFGPPMALQDSSMFTVPTSYPNPCIGTEWCMLLEVTATLKMLLVNFNETDYISLSLIVNGGDPISVSCDTHNYIYMSVNSMKFHDTILVKPGDTLDFVFENHTDDGKVDLIGDDITASHVEFKVISLLPVMQVG